MEKIEVSVLNTQSRDTAENSWHSDWILDESTFGISEEKERHEKWEKI